MYRRERKRKTDENGLNKEFAGDLPLKQNVHFF